MYVLRTGDDVSDRAVQATLNARGHSVDLGVRASQLDLAAVNLSRYHVVVILGATEEGIPSTAVTTLGKYLQSGGGVVADGQAIWYLGPSGAGTLRMPATQCDIIERGIASTTFTRADPADPTLVNGVPSSFEIPLTTARWNNRRFVEVCLDPKFGATRLYSSKGPGETTARAGAVFNQPTPLSRAVAFSVMIRSEELQNRNLQQAFVNSVEWAGAAGKLAPDPGPQPTRGPLRVYVLRTGDPESDAAIVRALSKRFHQVDLGVRPQQLESAAVRLTDYHVVVALGNEFEGIPTGALTLLNKYMQSPGGGGLLADGQLVWYLGPEGATNLRSPAKQCDTVQNDTARTTLEMIGPADPIIHRDMPPSFDLPLTTLKWNSRTYPEICLNPMFEAKLMFYSRSSADGISRPGLVVNELGAKSRIAAFSTFIRSRELSNPNLETLFVNTVEWLGALTEPQPSPAVTDKSKSLRVYVLRSGDESSNAEVKAALEERNHIAELGVRASQLTPAIDLSGYDVVVATGADEGIGQSAVNVLAGYLDGPGRLVLDGEMIWYLGPSAGPLRLPAKHCDTLTNAVPAATLERVDPADPLMHTDIPPSFDVDLSTLTWNNRQYNELCLDPAADGKIMFYSREGNEVRPRPAVVANQPQRESKAVQFSISFRRRELRNPNLRRLFVNAVEWAAGRIEPRPQIQVSPTDLGFIYNSSADTPRTRPLFVTANVLTPVNFTVAVKPGADWLSVDTAAATTPRNVFVRAVPTFLPSGTYTGVITLTGGTTVLDVPVAMTISGNAPCTYSLSPASATFPASGGSGKIGILSPPGCAWAVSSVPPWISVTSGSSGTGSGTVEFAISASTSTSSRTGTLSVSGTPFTITQAGTSLSFRAEPTSLDVRVAEGTTQTETRIISVIPSSGAPPFTASVSGGGWLSVAPASGNAPGSLIAAINPTGLGPGVYRGTVTTRVASATPAEQQTSITLTVEANVDPDLRVEPSSLTFSALQSGEIRTDRLLISNRGRGSLSFRAAVKEAIWLSVSAESGSISSTAPQSLTVSADPKGLQPGTYSGLIVISSPGATDALIKVVMTVNAARQTILLSQTALSYTAVVKGGAVPAQNFGVLNIGEGLMDWTAAATTLSGGSWLSVSRDGGHADAAALDVSLIDVSVNGTNLRPGEYYGKITIQSPTAANSPQIVSVVLQVLPEGSDPGPVVRPTGVIFVGAAETQDISISNVSAQTRAFNSARLTTDNSPLFTHEPAEATVTSVGPARISLRPVAGPLQPGVHRGVLTLLFNDGSVRTVNVLSIAPAQPLAASKSNRQAASCQTPGMVLAHTVLTEGFVASVGQGMRIEVKAADKCGNLLTPRRGAGVVVTANFSNGDSAVNLVHIGGGVWSGTWRPVTRATSTTLTITAFEAEGSYVNGDQIQISGSVRDSRTPIVTAGGLVNAASFQEGVPVAPGSLITIKGENLADASDTSNDVPVPIELSGVRVLVGERALPLTYVGPKQINAQVPFGLLPNTQHQISIRRGDQLSVPESITVAEALPGIFTEAQNGKGQGLIFKGGTDTLAKPGTPAKAGDTITVICTGLGAVVPDIDAGQRNPAEPPRRAPVPLELRIGGQSAKIVFAGLLPNSVALYQIQAVVPEGVGSGNAAEVTITAGPQTSPAVTMAVE